VRGGQGEMDSMLLRKCLLWLIVLCGTALSLPARAAPPLSVYGQLPGFEMAALSSSGDHVALIGRTGEERRLLVYDKDRKLVLSAPLDNAKVRGLNWAGDQFVLVTTSSAEKLQVWFTTDKAELGTMLVVDLASGRHWNVFENDPRVTGGVQGFFGVSERNGRWYGYFSAITYEFDGVATYLQSTAPELFEVDLQSNKAHLIARKNERGMQRWLVGNDGQVSARMEYYTFGGTWKIRNSAGEQIAIGVSKLGGIDLSGFGPSGASVIHRVTDDDDNSDHWFEAPLAGGAGTEILKGVAVNRLLFDKRTRQCVGYQLDGDQPSYKFYNARQQRIVDATIKAFPGLSVNLVDWSNAFDKLLVRTEGSGDPGTWWLVDIKTGNADQLGKSYALRSADVAPVTMIQYKAGDGMDIAAALTLPPGRTAKNLPVIVFAHGGPSIPASTGGRRLLHRAAMRCSSPISGVRQAMARRLKRPAMGNGARRCRPTFRTALPIWQSRA
jgi:dipeptidyl aminopeptidase/acylaminoacyl peptidase